MMLPGSTRRRPILPSMGDWIVAPIQLQLGGFDGGIVGLDSALVLALLRFVGVEGFFGNDAGCVQRLVAVEFGLRVLEERLVVGKGAFGLVERGLVGPWVDHHDGLALLNFLALGELDGEQFAADARLYRDAVIRGDGAEAGEINGHRFLFGGNDLHRHGAGQQGGGLVGGVRGGLLLVLIDAPNDEPDGSGEDKIDNNPNPAGSYGRGVAIRRF